MKATISANSCLKIVPENETEAYALRCWNQSQSDDSLLDRGVLHCAYNELDTSALVAVVNPCALGTIN